MTARIIDGKAIAAEVRAEVAERVRAHVAAGGRPPHLTAVLVGDDPASQTYVRNKGAACTEVGMTSDTLRLPATTSMAELLAEVARLNADPAVSGILVQTPLPAGLDEIAVMTALDPDKDVDGLHPISLGRLVQGEPVMVPCTPAGVQQMLLRSGVDPAGARVVVGRSMLVGKPLALLLGNKAPGGNATVTIAHTGTRDLGAVTREAEILIVAAGLIFITSVNALIDTQERLGRNLPFVGSLMEHHISGIVYGIGVLGLVFLFTLLYIIMPVAKVSLGRALAGGITAAILWEIVRYLLVIYYTRVSMVNVIYGSMATIIIVLLTLEAVALILLLGAQVIADLQRNANAGLPWHKDPEEEAP